jgi:transglutaminase-like putative cysteine protease
MGRAWGWGLVVLLGVAQAVGADAKGRVVEEIWEVAHVDGARVGSVHTTIRSHEVGGATRLRASSELDLTFRRRGALVRLRMEQATEEALDGKMLGVFMRQVHEGGRQLVLSGTVEGERLHVKVDGGRIERRIRWSGEVVGLGRLEHLFEKRKPKPGERFTFLRYEPTLNAVVTVRVAVQGREAVDVLGKPRSLLRVELVPDKIEVPGHTVQPPRAVWWLDDDFVPVRRQTELEGLGALVLTRATREAALAPLAAPGKRVDIGLKALVPLNRAVPRPYAIRTATYRVTLDVPAPGTALSRDAHQEVRNLKGNTFELVVHPPRPGGAPGAEKAGPEFLASSHYIDSADARVKELARRAAGGEKDAWKKALRIERWVKGAMRVDHTAPLVPAGEVARSLRGDCRAYALLTAALCRAEGLPARTAVGLLYVERGRKPYLGFHMWAEVWVDGRWLGLDAVLGQGGVGATHLKIADHSWHRTASLTPLLPVARVLGQIAVEVVRVEHGD